MARVIIHPGATVVGEVDFGDGVVVYPGAVIGCPGEVYDDKGPTDTLLRIGANTIIREGVVVQRGINGPTTIGAQCYIMHGTHVAHDCMVADRVTLSPYVVLGGHTVVHEGAVLGIHSATHQWVTIGALSMLGMGAMAVHDLPPGMKAVGVPARIIGPNREQPTQRMVRLWERMRTRKRMAGG